MSRFKIITPQKVKSLDIIQCYDSLTQKIDIPILPKKNSGKKVGEAQKLGQSCQKCEKLRKFGKKLVLYAF